MYRLLVADDEQIVLDSMRFIVEKHFAGKIMLEGASTGKEAIEKMEAFKPDIVFMDIHMPVIDGIEAIKEIRKRHKETIFIILTAYDYFTYAQEALNLNVLDYLLKPINKTKVVENISKAINILEEKMLSLQTELERREKFDRIVSYLENEFIYSSLLENEPYYNLNFYQDTFNLGLKYGYVMILNVENKEVGPKEENMDTSILKHEIYTIFRVRLKSLVKCLVGAVTLNRVIAYIPVREDEDEYSIRNRALAMAEEIKKELSVKVRIPYSIGIGRAYNIENFTKSYEEADRAMKLCGPCIAHISDKILVSSSVDLYPLNKEKLLIDKILAGDEAGAKLLFEEIFDWMHYNYKDISKVKIRLYELSIVVLRALSYQGLEDITNEQKTFMSIGENDDSNILKIDYQKNLGRLTSHMKNLQTKKANKLIGKVTKYVLENYAKDITLDDAAKEINMSYHYFSKFFKEETGQNFSDYLINIRIAKAKELLKDDSYSIKEICCLVGYKDPNYFSKIFKKCTGVTPTEFREYPN